MVPARAMKTRKRVLVKMLRRGRARETFAPAAFQLKPPLGSSAAMAGNLEQRDWDVEIKQ